MQGITGLFTNHAADSLLDSVLLFPHNNELGGSSGLMRGQRS